MSPAPPQPAASDLASKLQKLKGLLEAGLITQEDFDRKKQKLLEDL
jgi:hypothetical protein